MWNTDCDGSWGFSYFSIKIGETAQTGSVPVEVVVHGDPPLPESGVIQRCDPTPEKVYLGFHREVAA